MMKFMRMLTVIVAFSLMLVACGDKNQETDETSGKDTKEKEENQDGGLDIPDEVMKDAEADPIELKNQMNLKIGDTGYAIKTLSDGVLSITLNNVERTQAVSDSETLQGEKFYLIGDFTFKNIGDTRIELGRPDAVKASDITAVENDEFNNGDLLGVGNGLGGAFVNDDNRIPDEGIINSVYLEPGEEINQKTSITMRSETDEYMILFGFYDGNNRYYRNKVGFVFNSNEIK